MKKTLEEVFIETETWEKIPLKLFLINLKKGYTHLTKEFNKIMQKIIIGKIRKKTRDQLYIEAEEYKKEMIEVWATFWSAFEYWVKQWVQEELLEDKFLSDWWQLTEEQKKELEEEDLEIERKQDEVKSKLDLYLKFLKENANEVKAK